MQVEKRSFSGEPTPKVRSYDPEMNFDEAEEEEDEDKRYGKFGRTFILNTCVTILGFTKTGRLDVDSKIWYKLFNDYLNVGIPLVQNPGDDPAIIFKMQSLEDKRMLYNHIKENKFNGNKLRVKTVNFKEDKNSPPRKSLTQEEALDILYPGRNVLYEDWLKDKFANVKTIVEDNLKYMNGKEKEKLEDFVHMSPLEGYENKVLVHIEKSPTGEILYGLRAVDHSINGNAIVPLEHCLSVPPQMIPVVKGIISGLSAVGLDAYDPEAETGDLLGVVLRITELGTFMVIIILKKPDPTDFHELTREGLVLKEGEKLGIPFARQVLLAAEDAKSKLIKFFKSEKASWGIQGLYMFLVPEYVLLSQMASKVWSNLPKPEHVVGDTEMIEKLNGVVLKVEWNTDKHTEAFKSVLNIFDPFNSETTIYLVSPIIKIGHYFAKKCGQLIHLGFWKSDLSKKLKDKAKEEEITNIDYVNFSKRLKRPASTDNTVVIWWPFLCYSSTKKNIKITYLDQFLNFDFPNMVFISYWNRPCENHLQTHMEKVYSKLKINKIVPFDTEPYQEGFGLYLSFKGLQNPSNLSSLPKQNWRKRGNYTFNHDYRNKKRKEDETVRNTGLGDSYNSSGVEDDSQKPEVEAPLGWGKPEVEAPLGWGKPEVKVPLGWGNTPTWNSSFVSTDKRNTGFSDSYNTSGQEDDSSWKPRSSNIPTRKSDNSSGYGDDSSWKPRSSNIPTRKSDNSSGYGDDSSWRPRSSNIPTRKSDNSSGYGDDSSWKPRSSNIPTRKSDNSSGYGDDSSWRPRSSNIPTRKSDNSSGYGDDSSWRYRSSNIPSSNSDRDSSSWTNNPSSSTRDNRNSSNSWSSSSASRNYY